MKSLILPILTALLMGNLHADSGGEPPSVVEEGFSIPEKLEDAKNGYYGLGPYIWSWKWETEFNESEKTPWTDQKIAYEMYQMGLDLTEYSSSLISEKALNASKEIESAANKDISIHYNGALSHVKSLNENSGQFFLADTNASEHILKDRINNSAPITFLVNRMKTLLESPLDKLKPEQYTRFQKNDKTPEVLSLVFKQFLIEGTSVGEANTYKIEVEEGGLESSAEVTTFNNVDLNNILSDRKFQAQKHKITVDYGFSGLDSKRQIDRILLDFSYLNDINRSRLDLTLGNGKIGYFDFVSELLHYEVLLGEYLESNKIARASTPEPLAISIEKFKALSNRENQKIKLSASAHARTGDYAASTLGSYWIRKNIRMRAGIVHSSNEHSRILLLRFKANQYNNNKKELDD